MRLGAAFLDIVSPEVLQRLSLVVEKASRDRRTQTFVGLKFAITSLTRPVLLILVPKVRVMLRVGVLFAGEDSGPSRSIGVDAMAIPHWLSSQCGAGKLCVRFLVEMIQFSGAFGCFVW